MNVLWGYFIGTVVGSGMGCMLAFVVLDIINPDHNRRR